MSSPLNMILPLRVKLPDGSWLDLVRVAFEAERHLLPHRRYPLVELRKILGRQQLFDTVFNYVHFHVFQSLSALPDMEVLGSWGIERSHYTLRAEFNRNPFTGEMQFDLNFNSSLISMERVQQIAGCYRRVFQAMAEQPNVNHNVETLFLPSEPAIAACQAGDGGGDGGSTGRQRRR